MRALIFVLALLGPNLLDASVFVRHTNHYCIVREPTFSQVFNFTKLVDPNEDYSIAHDQGVVLRMQLCRPLKKNCNNLEGYSVCLSDHGNEVGLGKEPPEVSVVFGEIIFKYTGDQCDKNNKYTVNIKMTCDFGIKDGSGIELYAREKNDCHFNLIWRTQAACTTRKQINCTVDNESGHYDLSQLTNLSDNYEIFINSTYTLILNVCHSILFRLNSCKSNNGACLVNKETNKSFNLGEPTENLLYNMENRSLSLTYTDGALCSFNFPNAPLDIKTTITFICDLDAIGTLPKYIGGMENCHHNLIWTTASACSEQALHNKSLKETSAGSCIVNHPITGQLYNLTSLKNEEYSIKPFGIINEIYKYTVCGPVTNTTCRKGSGACRIHHNVSGGMANSKLMWKESGPYLNYTNGDLCNFNQQLQRYTIIEFHCGPDDSEIDDDDVCYDKIRISTELVCDKRIKTCATYDSKVSFEQLVRQSNNYVIKSDNTEYHINVCRPLVKEDGLECGEQAAMCKTTIVNGKRTNVINLGVPDQSPILTSDKSAVLVYHNGSICEEDNRKTIESIISFLCDINEEKGNPEFVMYKNCTYHFEWKTSLVCGDVVGDFNKNCSITNEFGDYRNLSVLFNEGYSVKSFKTNKTYNISFCGHKKHCNGAFVCDDKINYGTKASVISDYTSNLVNIQFNNGSECNGSAAKSRFTIICNKWSTSTAPTILDEDSCQVEFEWHTSKICKYSIEQKKTLYSTTEIVNTEKIALASIDSKALNGIEIFGIIVLVSIILVAICYLQKASRRSRLIEIICNTTSRNCDRVKYSRVNTVEEVQLLLNASDPTVIESDSDDELLDA